jgi:uncharacterized protein
MSGEGNFNSPFIKKYKTRNNSYIYDINTNRILQVDSIIFEIIDHIYSLSDDEILTRFQGRFDREDIRRALDEITKLSEERKLFSSTRPQGCIHKHSHEELLENIRSNIRMITLNVTEKCNLRCRYCQYSASNGYSRGPSNRNMGREVAFKAIEFLFEHSPSVEEGTLFLCFFGGEPLLNMPLIKDSIRYAKDLFKKRNLRLSITTNGTLLKSEVLKFFAEERVALMISLDGSEPIHDFNRTAGENKGTHALIMDNVGALSKYEDYFRKYVAFNVVIAPPYDLLGRKAFFMRYPEYFRHDNLTTTYVYAYDAKYRDIVNSKENVDELKRNHRWLLDNLKRGLLARKKADIIFELKLYDRMLRKIHTRPTYDTLGKEITLSSICIPGQNRPFIDVDGNIFMCEKSDNQIPLGNVEYGLNIRRIEQLISEYLDICTEDCCNCWALRLCDVCHIWGVQGDRLNPTKKRDMCVDFRDTAEKYLIIYSEIMENDEKGMDFLVSWEPTENVFFA